MAVKMIASFLLLLATTNLSAEVAGPRSPRVLKDLQHGASRVQAAGWTGGQAVEVAQVAELKQEETSAVSERFNRIVELVESAGTDGSGSSFNRAAQMLGIPVPVEGETVQQVNVPTDDGRIHSMIVRRNQKTGRVDVVLLNGLRENGKLRVRFYVASADGRLNSAVDKENGIAPQKLDLRQVREVYQREIVFWRDWEREYQRRQNGG